MKKPQLIVALDVETLAEVRDLLGKLNKAVDIYKVGSQLFTACGPAVVRFIEAQGKKVFLDLKYHDIPNTVASAVTSAVNLSVALERNLETARREKIQNLGLLMMTLHTSGGLEMMQTAVEAATKAAQASGVSKPLLVGVTVLTSVEKTDSIRSLVLERAALAKKAGLDGVVASCDEAKAIREKFGRDFVIVTPGIRPAGADTHDQQRIATPSVAVQSGSDYLVVGRPIVQAQDPLKAAEAILKEMGSVK
jgi:orotidine-5'-phosphate decarboxylase